METKIRSSYDAMDMGFEDNVFTKMEYLSAHSNEYGWFEGYGYIMPYYIENVFLFRRLVFTAAPIKRKNAEDNKGEYGLFLDEVIDLVKKKHLCDIISKPQSNAVFMEYPKKSISCPWGTYVKCITYDDLVLLSGFHQKHRNVIKKAIRDGVQVECINDVDVVYNVIKKTMTRQRLPFYPKQKFIKKINENMSQNVLMMSASYKGVVQGVALILYDKKYGYYLYGGSLEEPYLGSMNLLQYEAMKLLREKGCEYYDFVGARLKVVPGSKYEGIQRFKRRFSPELIHGYTFKVIISPIKYYLYETAIRIYFMIKRVSYCDPIKSMMTE